MKIVSKVLFWIGVISLVFGIIMRLAGGAFMPESIALSASAFLRFSMTIFLMLIAMIGMFPYVAGKKE